MNLYVKYGLWAAGLGGGGWLAWKLAAGQPAQDQQPQVVGTSSDPYAGYGGGPYTPEPPAATGTIAPTSQTGSGATDPNAQLLQDLINQILNSDAHGANNGTSTNTPPATNPAKPVLTGFELPVGSIVGTGTIAAGADPLGGYGTTPIGQATINRQTDLPVLITVAPKITPPVTPQLGNPIRTGAGIAGAAKDLPGLIPGRTAAGSKIGGGAVGGGGTAVLPGSYGPPVATPNTPPPSGRRLHAL